MENTTRTKWPHGYVITTPNSGNSVGEIRTSWMQPASPSTDSSSLRTLKEKAQLGAGVWIYRYEVRVWREPHIFDVNAELPIIEAEVPGVIHNWKHLAMCAGMDDEVFFGQEIPGRPGMGASQLAFAREICGQCPVVRDCLEHALTQPESYGIWAGTSGRMRERLQKQMSAGQGMDIVMDTYLATL